MPSRSALASPAGAVGQRRVGPAARPPPTPPCEDPGTPPAPPCAGLALLGQSAQGSHRDNQPNASATYQSSSSSASRVSKTIRHPEHRARHPERCIKRREKIKQRPVGSCHLSFSVTCLGPRLTVLCRLLDCFFALRHRTSTRDAGDLFSSAQASSSPPRPSVSAGVNCSFAEQPRLCGEKHHGEADPGVPGCDAAGGGHLSVRTHQTPVPESVCLLSRNGNRSLARAHPPSPAPRRGSVERCPLRRGAVPSAGRPAGVPGALCCRRTDQLLPQHPTRLNASQQGTARDPRHEPRWDAALGKPTRRRQRWEGFVTLVPRSALGSAACSGGARTLFKQRYYN